MTLVHPTKTAMPTLDPVERRHLWDEVAVGYTVERALAEARRCIQCQDPVCELGCPVGVPIRDFVRRVQLGDFAGAAELIRTKNVLPAICGRVCPVEHQCEARCAVLGRLEPVGIGRLERFVADWERTHPSRGVKAGRVQRPDTIAIVGSGPAGLTAASDLARLGYRVTVFEALHALGGVLRYGIPEFRLPKAIVDEDVERLRGLGVEFRTDVVVGKTVTIDELLGELGYGAVFVGTGAGSPKFMGIPGENLEGVYSANEYLTRVNLMRAYDFPGYDTPVKRPTRAAVIGAGDTAMDAARVSIRLGAEETHVVYRRGRAEMGARAEDFERAGEEGAIFDWLTLPTRFLGNGDGRVRALECIRMELGEPDESGRPRPVPVPDSEFELEANLVVIALGTNPNPLIPQTTPGIDVDGHGCVVVDPETGATSRPGVFAGGDIATGAATVILAMGAGRRAAAAIHDYLEGGAADGHDGA
jgi:glutamate synthase (NADPH/NADH) small chain